MGSRLDVRKGIVAAVFLGLYAFLLFTRLGHYALWDDEANTALFGLSVWRTGDTDARIGENLVAFRGGFELDGMANRRIAPLPYYVVAPSVALFGGTWGPRLPFAIFGFLVALFVQYWLWKSDAPTSRWVLVALGFLGNISLILYARQARYYALAVLLAVVIAFLYVRFDGGRRMRIALASASVALFATHYVAWVSVAAALGVDWLLFGRRRGRLAVRDVAFVAAVHAIIGGAIVRRWNPLGKPLTNYVSENWWADKATLWWWNLRDLNGCEFLSVLLLALAPLLSLAGRPKDEWLVRIPLGIAVGAAAVALFSPLPVGWSTGADIRYMIVAIPAGIFLAVRVFEAMPLSDTIRSAAAVLVFATNLLHFTAAPLLGASAPAAPRSTLLAYLGELAAPPPSPYREAAAWLGRHAAAGDTVHVTPDYAVFPLMYHRPELVYVWQLPPESRREFPRLADHHFRGNGFPVWLVSFGKSLETKRTIVALASRGARYQRAQAITSVRGRDETRPELTLRTFQARPVDDRETQGIYIHRRMDP